MPIPKAEFATVPQVKLSSYLLNLTHPTGAAKARWFRAQGYSASNPQELEADLIHIVRETEDFSIENTPYGVKYRVAGEVEAPGGRRLRIQTVWIVESGTNAPRLVTADPAAEEPTDE